MKMRTITCFGDQTSGTFLILNWLGLSDEDNWNETVFNSITLLVCSLAVVFCTIFLTMPVGFNFNLTFGLKPQQQVGGIKIVTV